MEELKTKDIIGVSMVVTLFTYVVVISMLLQGAVYGDAFRILTIVGSLSTLVLLLSTSWAVLQLLKK